MKTDERIPHPTNTNYASLTEDQEKSKMEMPEIIHPYHMHYRSTITPLCWILISHQIDSFHLLSLSGDGWSKDPLLYSIEI